jgi:hypothetical protein
MHDTGMPWRAILRFFALVLLAELTATLALAWYFGLRTVEHWVNGATAVALLSCLLGLSLLGPGRFARGHELEPDARHHTRGPGGLDNRARGVLLVVGAVFWLALAIAVDQGVR